MPEFLNVQAFQAFLQTTIDSLRDALIGPGTPLQFGSIGIAFALAWLATRVLRPGLLRFVDRLTQSGGSERLRRQVNDLTHPVIWFLLQWVFLTLSLRDGLPSEVLRITSTLLGAWIAITIASSIFRDPAWSRAAATLAWIAAALRLLHLFEPAMLLLDGMAVTIGGVRLSVLLVLKGAALTIVLLKLALGLSAMLQRRIDRFPNLTPSSRVLAGKMLQLTFVTLAIVMAMGSVGIDLTAFAIFSGAVGVGVGFGLQKVVSNLVSGIILLIDRSVKPGDVIEVGGTYGWVNSLGARYASIVTRDGTEHLIPNEDLITQSVVNWSFSDNLVRRRVKLGIHYKADLDLATELILKAAKDTNRILQKPEPQCLLTGFGDSSVDLELRFWISDPQNGTTNVADRVLRRIWKAFHENDIEIPYPQTDLHIRSAPALEPMLRSARDSDPVD